MTGTPTSQYTRADRHASILDLEKPLPESPYDGRSWRGWRGSLSRGLIATVASLICNIVLIGYCLTGNRYDASNSVSVVFAGDCGIMQTADNWGHFGINILATLLLSATGVAMHCVTAPTRADLDRIHAKGKSADVGVFGLRNWRIMTWSRKTLWCLMAISCLPLHLFYNSILITTFQATDWTGFFVPQSFVEGQAFNATYLDSIRNGAVHNLTQLQQAAVAGDLQELDIGECKKILAPALLTNYTSILFVSTSETNLGSPEFFPSLMVLHDSLINNDTWQYPNPTAPNDTIRLVRDHHNWIESWNATSTKSQLDQVVKGNLSAIDYCLLQSQPAFCKVELVPGLIGLVAIFNLLGLVCVLVVLFKPAYEPLVTVGDAIASFLSEPCDIAPAQNLNDFLPRTRMARNRGSKKHTKVAELPQAMIRGFPGDLKDDPDSIVTTSISADSSSAERLHQPWRSTTHRWHHGASPRRWAWTSGICIAYWLTGIIGVIVVGALSNQPGRVIFTQGLGGPLPASPISPSLIPSLNSTLANVVLSNIFQVVLAFIYLCYHALFARMALAAELARYAARRAALRVSAPRGHQRATYWLALPYAYSFPLLAVDAFLHWALSRSIFYEQVKPRFAIAGGPSGAGPALTLHTTIINPEALLVLALAGGAAILGVFAVGWLKKLPAGAPVVGGDSRALAAVSGGRKGIKGSDEALRRVKWGVVHETPEGGVVGFSSYRVKPLVDGKVYKTRYT